MTYDYYPEDRNFPKKVIIEKIEKYINLTQSDIANRLMGMGLFEWERLMGFWFVKAIETAYEQHQTTANITIMFSCDLIGVDECGRYRKPQEKVIKDLMDKLFDLVTEEDDKIIVKLKEVEKK